jgi:hypothetical protein
VSTTATPDRLTSLPDEHALAATVVALEDHAYSHTCCSGVGHVL